MWRFQCDVVIEKGAVILSLLFVRYYCECLAISIMRTHLFKNAAFIEKGKEKHRLCSKQIHRFHNLSSVDFSMLSRLLRQQSSSKIKGSFIYSQESQFEAKNKCWFRCTYQLKSSWFCLKANHKIHHTSSSTSINTLFRVIQEFNNQQFVLQVDGWEAARVRSASFRSSRITHICITYRSPLHIKC